MQLYPLFFMMAARWLVLFPGAAQASITWPPTGGSRRYAGRQLAYKKEKLPKINHFYTLFSSSCLPSRYCKTPLYT